jgi:hypothetical protein
MLWVCIAAGCYNRIHQDRKGEKAQKVFHITGCILAYVFSMHLLGQRIRSAKRVAHRIVEAFIVVSWRLGVPAYEKSRSQAWHWQAKASCLRLSLSLCKQEQKSSVGRFWRERDMQIWGFSCYFFSWLACRYVCCWSYVLIWELFKLCFMFGYTGGW